MREFKYGVGVIAPNFLLNLLLVKMSQKSSMKANFGGKNQKKICPTTVVSAKTLVIKPLTKVCNKCAPYPLTLPNRFKNLTGQHVW